MPFMVIYNKTDGGTCTEQADAIDEAALFVERLRNQESIEEIHIYRMEEISFAFRPYYKVELGLPERMSADRGETAADHPDVDDEAAPTPSSALAELMADEDDGLGANGRRGLFGR